MGDHDRVRELLPQRYPMLLIDRVDRVEPGRSITAVKAVTAGEPCYRHVPDGAPLDAYAYPASLLLESLGQAAALIWLADAGSVGTGHVLMFAAARGFRMTGAAYPGDVLRHEVELTQEKAGTLFATGRTYATGRPIAAVDSIIAVRRAQTVLTETATNRSATSREAVR